MSTPARTFTALLDSRLRHDPGRPLVTAYDDASGERTELSATTYANWVSKTANLLTDELGLDLGETLLVDLPPHWLVPVFAGAAWLAGLTVTADPAVPHSAVVRGPDPGRAVEGREVLACALLPFAVRYADPMPPGVHDYGVLWPGQSDVFLPWEPASPDAPAYAATGGVRTQADLLEAAASTAYEPGVRLLTDAHPLADGGVAALLAPLVHDGSLVLVRHPDAVRWAAHLDEELVTHELRALPTDPPRS